MKRNQAEQPCHLLLRGSRTACYLAAHPNTILLVGLFLELMQRTSIYNSYWYWQSPSQKACPYGVVRAIR
jgi:hypothetical protein